MKKDSEKIEELFSKYGDEILRTCMLILKSHALAEDAAMTVYEKAFTSLHRFRGEASERTWLIKIALNVCRSTLRSSAYKTSMNGEIPETASDKNEILQAENRTAVSDALMSLPEVYREAAVLCLYNELTVKEAALFAGISESKMTYRIRKAKELLKERLKEYYYDKL